MKLKNLGLGLLALSLLALPAAAQNRSNKGGQDAQMVGDERAAHVHNLNAAKKKQKKDKDRDPAASTNKTKGKTQGRHTAKGHTH